MIPKTDAELPVQFMHGGESEGAYRSLDVAIGAPTEKLSRQNAPPQFLHLRSLAGRLSGEGGLVALSTQAEPLDPESIVPRKRDYSSLLGIKEWGGKKGRVLLAPSYPFGGVESDHLLFLWTRDGNEHAVSLHAWIPLPEALAMLEIVVERMPKSSDDGCR